MFFGGDPFGEDGPFGGGGRRGRGGGGSSEPVDTDSYYKIRGVSKDASSAAIQVLPDPQATSEVYAF